MARSRGTRLRRLVPARAPDPGPPPAGPGRRLGRRLARFVGFVDPVAVRTVPKVESVVVGQLRLGRDVEGLRAELLELRARVDDLERAGSAPRQPRPRQHPPEHGRALGRRAGTLEVEPSEVERHPVEAPRVVRLLAAGGRGQAR